MKSLITATASLTFLTGAFFVAQLAATADKKPVDKAAVQAAIAQGDAFADKRDYEKAFSCYNKAEKISQHQCAECLLRKAGLEKRLGNLNDALHDAKKALKEAGDAKDALAEAHLLCAVALGKMTTNPKDKKLAQACGEVQQALALEPGIGVAHFDLGYLMLKQGRDAEGVAELKTFLASAPLNADVSESVAREAREFIARPRLAREDLAPGFTITTLEGSQLSLDSLHGKVVLLDFWGTWCPPCRESVPALVSLHKKFQGQPVEFVGISSDTDQKAWSSFVAAHHMDWPEYIDLSHDVLPLFDIHAFPTYIVLDGDGVIRFRHSGYGFGTGAEIEGAIQKALKETSESAAATASQVKP